MERRPLAKVEAPAKMEGRVPFSMKLKESEIEAVKARAARKGLGHTTLAREYFLMGMRMDDALELQQGHVRVTA